MRPADSKPNCVGAPKNAAQSIPTFIATDLLEKLIADRDAAAVDKVLTERRRN